MTIYDGADDWTPTGAANFSAYPNAGDTVEVPAHTTVYVKDLASLLVVSNLAQVTLSGAQVSGSDTSKIVFIVPEGETWGVESYVRQGNSGVASGHLVKRGKGALRLLKGEENQEAPYNCHITVEEGSVAMPTNLLYSSKYTYTGLITVSNGATFFAPGFANTSGTWNWLARGFRGDGMVTNPCAHSLTIGLNVNYRDWTWDRVTRDFGGSFHGDIVFSPTRMRQFLSGTNSTFTAFQPKADDGTYSAGEGTIGVKLFGNAGEPSSIGSGSSIRWVGGGGVLYLGEGEVSNKILEFQEGGHPFIDGGEHGGLVFTADLNGSVNNSHSKADKTVTLMGSNTTACALSGNIPSWSSSAYTFHIVKKGPGAWRLDYPSSTMTGKITVEEGTLGFSQLFEKGSYSSFGRATSTAASTAAITLGTSETEGGIGLLSADGKASCSTTRPIALAGDGRIVNNSTNFLGIGMIQVANSSGATLTLDGTNTNSVVYDLADGEGPLSLVKDGAGTWSLAGSNTFTGTLTVRQGTLVLKSGPGSPSAYTWYKFVVKAQVSGSSTILNICELGLFDADGSRINGSLGVGTSVSILGPGQVAYGGSIVGERDSTTIDMLFDEKYAPWKGSLAAAPSASSPITWATIVMRVPEGSNPAASWDVGVGGSGNVSNEQYPGSCVLMGSVDGVHYETIAETNITSYGTAYRPWAATKEGVTSQNSSNHTGGFTIGKTVPSVLEYVMPTNAVVSVASNATLRAEGGRYTLSNLKVSAAGAGTIDGFDFAESGTLAVVDAPRGGATLPLQFVDCTGIRNIKNWTLTVNGAPSGCKIHVKDSALEILPPGLMIIFR